MRIYFKIFGWILIIPSVIVYILLLIEAYKFISEKIGSFFAFILLIFTNVVGPNVYIIWYWIDESFPTRYFLLSLGATLIFFLGRFIKGLASEEQILFYIQFNKTYFCYFVILCNNSTRIQLLYFFKMVCFCFLNFLCIRIKQK